GEEEASAMLPAETPAFAAEIAEDEEVESFPPEAVLVRGKPKILLLMFSIMAVPPFKKIFFLYSYGAVIVFDCPCILERSWASLSWKAVGCICETRKLTEASGIFSGFPSAQSTPDQCRSPNFPSKPPNTFPASGWVKGRRETNTPPSPVA